jgi:anti-sigma factor RsiW
MNRRDLELLSSYLDGQLKPSESARLEARLSMDPSLRAVLDDLRSTRGLLRRLPMRKAPRNFTLTPGMVGKNPPLPRTYPAFRFVTALASLLLFFSMGLNYLVPQLAAQPPMFGMGGGGAPEVYSAEAPAATEAPAAAAPAEEPSVQMAPMPTPTIASLESARGIETPAGKEGATGESTAQDQSQVQNASPEREVPPPVPPTWQLALAGIAVLGVLVMVFMRRLAAERWRQK